MQFDRWREQHSCRFLQHNIDRGLAVIAVGIICLLTTIAWAVTNSFTITVNYAFTPLHTYFIAASACSDANAGTSTAAPWCTPNHSVVCGDVILVQSGAYNNGFQSFGAVSGCPSNAGGIDGTGGIYFAVLLCAGGAVGDCSVGRANPSGDICSTAAICIKRNNWAVEGFKVTTNPTPSNQDIGYLADGRLGGPNSPIVHHVAFVNDISIGTAMGYATADGGTNNGVSPGNGVDQFAVVGSIAQDSASWRFPCIASIDNAGPANFDNSAGTHVFFAGNFAINNQQSQGDCVVHSDGEGLMFDTFDAHGYTGQSVMQDNIIYITERFGLQVFYQNSISPYPSPSVIRIFNNTIFDTGQGAFSPDGFSYGNVNINGAGGSTAFPFPLALFNNVSSTVVGISGNGTALYALQLASMGSAPGLIIGGSGIENIFKGNMTGCRLNFCDAGFNVSGDINQFGSNYFENPAYKNTADLLANHSGAPNCSGFETTVACMGWNYDSQTAASLSVIDDLTPTSAHSAGKGYQPPRRCVTSGERFNDYPRWLKGIVYLHASSYANGATIVEKDGLLTKPCGM